MTAINTLKAHLALNVKDVGNSIEFYKKMLGIEPSKVRTGYAKFDVVNISIMSMRNYKFSICAPFNYVKP